MSSALREAIFAGNDWRARLLEHSNQLKACAMGSPGLAEQALDLAAGLELCEPNRVRAVEMYLLAWKAAHAHPTALMRARELCLEIGELHTAAKISRLIFQQTNNTEFLLEEGLAWLDSALPDKAIPALMAADKRMPGDPRVALALVTARMEWSDGRDEAERLEAGAGAAKSGQKAAELLLSAARILRLLENEQLETGRLLARAFDAYPLDAKVFALYESWLLEQGHVDRLTAMYRRRSEVAQSTEDAVELMRRAGTKLALSNVHVGLAMQLLTGCLQRCYREGVEGIPGHLATLALLRQFSETAGTERDFLGLLAEGTAAEMPEEESVALLAMALDLSWSRLRDAELSHPYASLLSSFVSTHPALVAYHSEGGMARGHELHSGPIAENPCQPDDLPSAITMPEPAVAQTLAVPDSLDDVPELPDALVVPLPDEDEEGNQLETATADLPPSGPVAPPTQDLPWAEPLPGAGDATPLAAIESGPVSDGGQAFPPAPSSSPVPDEVMPLAASASVTPLPDDAEVATPLPSVGGFSSGPAMEFPVPKEDDDGGISLGLGPEVSDALSNDPPDLLLPDLDDGPAASLGLGTAPLTPAPQQALGDPGESLLSAPGDKITLLSPDSISPPTQDELDSLFGDDKGPAPLGEVLEEDEEDGESGPGFKMESIDTAAAGDDALVASTETADGEDAETEEAAPRETVAALGADSKLIDVRTGVFEAQAPPPGVDVDDGWGDTDNGWVDADASPEEVAATPTTRLSSEDPVKLMLGDTGNAPVATPSTTSEPNEPEQAVEAADVSEPKDSVKEEQPDAKSEPVLARVNVKKIAVKSSSLKPPITAPGAETANRPGIGGLIPKSALSALRQVKTKPNAPRAKPMPDGGKQRARRVALPIDVVVSATNIESMTSVTRDISETGMFVLGADRFSIDTKVEVRITLPSSGAWEVDSHELGGVVVRHDPGRGVGINFVDPPESLVARIRELIGAEGEE